MSGSSTADSRFTATECLDPGDWQRYRGKASSAFLTLFSAQMQPPAPPSEDWNPFIPISGRRYSAGWERMLKRQRGTGTAFQVARPVLLRFAFTFLHQEVFWSQGDGGVEVRSWSCSNTLDYRRGPHPSTPECSRVGTSAAAEQHVSRGTRKKK